MTNATLSRIIPADKTANRQVEKWRMPDWNNAADRAAVKEQEASPQTPGNARLTEEHRQLNARSETDPAAATSDGFTRGYADGIKAAEAEIKVQLENIKSMVKSLATPMNSVSEDVASELINLSVDIARTILKKELDQSPELLISFIEDALGRLPAQSAATQIAINPQDLARLQAYEDASSNGLLSDSSEFSSIEWVADATVLLGQFVVTRDTSRVHGGIETMLKRVCAAAGK